MSQRIFGTSMMFGVGTHSARLHVDAFVNMLGEDSRSWGLSHKGFLWHAGKQRQYTKPFRYAQFGSDQWLPCSDAVNLTKFRSVLFQGECGHDNRDLL